MNNLSPASRPDLCKHRRSGWRFATIALLIAVSSACSPLAPGPSATVHDFLVIAHRGASGYRPEHTLAAYELAIAQGADFIEVDLVPAADGTLIVRHENALAMQTAGGLRATTDVAERAAYAERLQTKLIDGRKVRGWFSEDFALAEIRALFAREPLPALRPESASYTDLRVPTLTEVIALLQRPEHRHVGLYAELKHPTYFRHTGERRDGSPIGIDTAATLVATLSRLGFTDPSRLYLQCFEVATLRRLKHDLLPAAGFSAPLVQLVSAPDRTPYDLVYARDLAPAEFAAVYGPLADALRTTPRYAAFTDPEFLALVRADYASGLGPHKRLLEVVGRAANGAFALHPYTVRAEPAFLRRERGAVADSAEGELARLRDWGASGAFIDQPDVAVAWRDAVAQP